MNKVIPIFHIAILTFCLLDIQAQTTQIKPDSSITNFKNQGEQEDSWSVNFFTKNYSKQNFAKFDGAITINEDTIKYSDTYFLIWVPRQYKSIFSSGIFYLTIITGQAKSKQKLTISNLEELTFLNTSPTQKRFRFWLNGIGILNPTVCFIELTNKNATDKTDIETFIKGASLTFYKEGWIVI